MRSGRRSRQLLDLPIVGDVRGAGYFYALELVKDKETRAGLHRGGVRDAPARLPLGRALRRGLICRADDRGDPVIQISPPLVAGQAEFDELTGILGDVLAEAGERVGLGNAVTDWRSAAGATVRLAALPTATRVRQARVEKRGEGRIGGRN